MSLRVSARPATSSDSTTGWLSLEDLTIEALHSHQPILKAAAPFSSPNLLAECGERPERNLHPQAAQQDHAEANRSNTSLPGAHQTGYVWPVIRHLRSCPVGQGRDTTDWASQALAAISPAMPSPSPNQSMFFVSFGVGSTGSEMGRDQPLETIRRKPVRRGCCQHNYTAISYGPERRSTAKEGAIGSSSGIENEFVPSVTA